MPEINYQKAGVNVEKANRLIPAVKRLAEATNIPGVLSGVGGFSALFDFKKLNYRDPLMAVTTDGVGTKLEIAELQGKHDTVGIDLVAMSVNDLVTCGARPIIFLDYIATGKLNEKQYRAVLGGVSKGCQEAGCALVGGETAEMPGFYQNDQYDLAGFAVGLVERKKMINGLSVKAGDAVLGLLSSGFHSNGFSLVRKLFSKTELRGEIGRKFLTPTKIYVKAILNLIEKVNVKSIAHITGGGFYDNIPRVIPKNLGVSVEMRRWNIPELFWMVQERSGISLYEMFRTFNMGVGMVVVAPQREAEKAVKILKKFSVDSCVIGKIVKGKGVQIL